MAGFRERFRGLADRFRRSAPRAPAAEAARGGPVAASLRGLLDDPAIPASVREAMASDFRRVETMLDRLERDELHVAVFGRVSAGKSALGNALLGRDAFAVGVLHGTTTEADAARLDEASSAGLVLIDTPGINELAAKHARGSRSKSPKSAT
jgi:GTP-binding protein Era